MLHDLFLPTGATYYVCVTDGVVKCIQFCKVKFSGTMTSYEFSYFLKCSFIIKQKHIWISWTEISNKSVHAGLALFNEIIFFYIVFFTFHIHIAIWASFILYCFQTHLIPVESFLHYFTVTESTGMFTQVLYGGVCIEMTVTNCSDAKTLMLSALLDPLPQTHKFQLLRNGMYLSSCFYFFSFGFTEICVSSGYRRNKNELDFLINMSNWFFSFLFWIKTYTQETGTKIQVYKQYLRSFQRWSTKRS